MERNGWHTSSCTDSGDGKTADAAGCLCFEDLLDSDGRGVRLRGRRRTGRRGRGVGFETEEIL